MQQAAADGTDRGARLLGSQWLDGLDLVARVATGLVLLYAGAVKSLDFETTLLAVRSYRLSPAFLERPIAFGLPWLEVALGTLLLLGLSTRLAAVAVTCLSALFLAVMAQALARGLPIGCGCFGAGGGRLSWLDLARDQPLLGVGLYLTVRRGWRLSLDRFLPTGHADTAGGAPGPWRLLRRQDRTRDWLRLAIPTTIITVVVTAAVGVSALTAGGGGTNQGVSVAGPSRSQPIAGGSTPAAVQCPRTRGRPDLLGELPRPPHRTHPLGALVWGVRTRAADRHLGRPPVPRRAPDEHRHGGRSGAGPDAGAVHAPARLHLPGGPRLARPGARRRLRAHRLPAHLLRLLRRGVARATIGVAPTSVVRALMAQIAG